MPVGPWRQVAPATASLGRGVCHWSARVGALCLGSGWSGAGWRSGGPRKPAAKMPLNLVSFPVSSVFWPKGQGHLSVPLACWSTTWAPSSRVKDVRKAWSHRLLGAAGPLNSERRAVAFGLDSVSNGFFVTLFGLERTSLWSRGWGFPWERRGASGRFTPSWVLFASPHVRNCEY